MKADEPSQDDIEQAWEVIRTLSRGKGGRNCAVQLKAAMFLIEQGQGRAPERGERRVMWPDGSSFTASETLPEADFN